MSRPASLILASLASCVALLACAPVYGQVADDFHQFTDKKGQQILAKLLDVSKDRRTMKIQRADGIEFETEINVLSLDDQQYIKDWLKNRPEIGADFHLDVAIAKKQKDSEEHNTDSYELKKKYYTYEITVKNLSREVLESATLEYTVVWEDQVRIYESKKSEEWTFTTPRYEEGGQRVRLSGSTDLEALAYNRETVFETGLVEIDEVAYFGNQVLEKDDPVGVIVRILSKDSSVIAEVREGSLDEEAYTWESVLAYSEPETDK